MFKPRIFISSTLKDKLQLRETLSNRLSDLGAEVLLYEKNLTPSVNKSVYREEIVKSDFVIFIFDEKYGTKTDSGVSGIEEEFRLIDKSSKPSHIYLKNTSNKFNKSMKKLTEYIQSNNYSYSFFNTAEELVQHILSTVFTISHDITIKNLINAEIDENVVKIISSNLDIKKAMEHINRIEAVFNFENSSFHTYDSLNSNLYISVFDMVIGFYHDNGFGFIDDKLTELLNAVYNEINSIIHFIAVNSVAIPCQNETLIENLGFYRICGLDKFDSYDYEKLRECRKILIENYKKFKQYVQDKMMKNNLQKINL